jgi:hypothetical protein
VTVIGCDSVDPTEEAFGVTFLNDLRQPVALKLCSDDACRSFDYADNVHPGARHAEGISDRSILTRWLVADSDGRTLGCLPLSFEGKYANVVVRVSQKVRCPGRRPLRVQHGRKTSDGV